MKNRDELAEYFAQQGFKTGAEIGVLAGEFGAKLCKANPGLKYYGIDNWSEKMDNSFHKQARENLSPYNATLIKKTSMEAVGDFENGSLDFVYIDADHAFDAVVVDIIHWAKKVKKGGIVSGDDYKRNGVCGVIEAVDGYVKSHSHRLKTLGDSTWWFRQTWNY